MSASSGQHLRLPEPALCLSAHPSTPTIAAGLSTSGLLIAPFPSTSTTPASISHPFGTPCRATAFFPSSTHLIASTSSKIHLLDANSPKPLHSYTLPGAPKDAKLCATTFTTLTEHLSLAGDDDGGLHLLDMRTRNIPVASLMEQGDYISSICPVKAYSTSAILVTSGDGTLCAYDLRMPPYPRLKLQYATDSFQDDLLSLAVLPDFDCAVAGTLSGAVNVYSLRLLDAEKEIDESRLVSRFYGHPDCVNSILSTGFGALALTASTDGLVRIIDVAQKKLVGVLDYEKQEEDELQVTVVGKRKKRAEDVAWPIEDMVSVSGLDKPTFALLGHDQLIRFCDGSMLVDDESEELEVKSTCKDSECKEGEEVAEPEVKIARRKKKKKKKGDLFGRPSKDVGSCGFFDGL